MGNRMRKNIIFIGMSFLLASVLYPQDRQLMQKSDSLFVAGVELYKQGKYEEAVPLFAVSDSMDKAEMDSADVRRDYSAMWLAHCYKNLGQTEKADSIYSPLYDAPVDRRLTVVSDSLTNLANRSDSLAQKIALLKKVAAVEAKELGEAHYWRKNTICNLAFSQLLAKDTAGVSETFDEMYRISVLNNSLRFNENFLTYVFACILQKNMPAEEYSAVREKMIYVASLSKAETDGSLWSLLLKNKIMSLQNVGKDDEAYAVVEDAYAGMRATGAVNANMFEISSLLGNALARRFAQSKDLAERDSIDARRMGIYNDMLSMAERLWGNSSFEYGMVLNKIANTNLGLGKALDREKGRRMLLRAFDLITDSANVVSHPFDAVSVMEGAYHPFDVAGAGEEFVEYSWRVVNIIEKTFGKDLIDISGLKGRLADELCSSRNVEYRKQGIAIYTELIESNSGNPRKLLDYLKDRAFRYRLMKEYDKSLADYLRVDSLYESAVPVNDFQEESYRIDVYRNIAECYLGLADTADYQKYKERYCRLSESLIDRIVRGEVQPVGSPFDDDFKLQIIKGYADYFFMSLNTLSLDCGKAEKYYKLCLDELTKSNPAMASRGELERQIYTYLTHIYIYEYDFANGYDYAMKLIRSAKRDDDSYGYARGLDLLSDLYERVSVEPELSLGYKLQSCELQSEDLVRNRNAMLKEQFITTYDAILYEWTKCADLYNYLGDAAGVDKCYGRLLHYIELLDGKESPNYAEKVYEWLSLYKIPSLRRRDDGLEEARTYCDSLASFYGHNRHLLERWPFYNYYDIGREYYLLGDTTKAAEYYDIYGQELRQKYPTDYQSRIEYLDLMKAKVYLLDRKDRVDAFKELEAGYAGLLPEHRSEYISLLSSIASEYSSAGDKMMEMEYCRKILDVKPDNRYSALNLFEKYRETGMYAEILPMFDKVSADTRKSLLEEFKSQPAEYRENMWQSYADVPFSLGEPLAEMFGDSVSATTIYNNLLMRKNFLLNASISAENLIKTEGDSLLLAKYDRMVAIRDALNGSDADSITDMGHTMSREQAGNLVRRFNQEIMQRAAILGDYTESLFVEWEAVQENLRAADMAVEFTRYVSFDGDVSYGAVVLQNVGKPVFIPLFKENELKDINKSLYYSSYSLYDLVWRPLENYLKDKTSVYFSPDGFLYSIGIENIPSPSGNCLMSERYDLYRLSSTRELVNRGDSVELESAAIYGGIKYDTDVAVMVSDSRKYRNRDLLASTSAIADSLNLRSGVRYLPATMEEAVDIDTKLEKIEVNPELFTDTVGTEASFKDLSGRKKNLLHIATHGFYWTETEARRLGGLSFLNMADDNAVRYSEDKALTRSGLLLAGANNALMGRPLPEGVDDGILTAKEISRLDLRGLDLVVLSACQTGLGEITGDGVFGLQRGFKKAGANTLLMSLWSVDDDATRLLMTRFYENYISGMTKMESLREAQTYVRDYEIEKTVTVGSGKRPITAMEKEQARKRKPQTVVRKIRPYADPRYWAAFILLDAL